MRFFLARNMAIARDRAWAYTVESRGKGPDFWQPYVEEWDQPPRVDMNKSFMDRVLGNWFGRYAVKQGEGGYVILSVAIPLTVFLSSLSPIQLLSDLRDSDISLAQSPWNCSPSP